MRVAVVIALVTSALGMAPTYRATPEPSRDEHRELQAPAATIDAVLVRRSEAPARSAGRCFELGWLDMALPSGAPSRTACVWVFESELAVAAPASSIRAHGARAPPDRS